MSRLSHSCFLLLVLSLPALHAHGEGDERYVVQKAGTGTFQLAAPGVISPLYMHSSDFAGVRRVLGHLKSDIGRVTGYEPDVVVDPTAWTERGVIVGTIGKSPLIDRLIEEKKLDVADTRGKREMFLLTVVDDPMPGMRQALVIAGSDKRGTIYGIYDLSEQIGVSPWYWWADVPARRSPELHILSGRFTDGEPAVKYRGIFINDEAPAFSGWTFEKFGGFNAKMYEHVFELILRLKGNFLWPAMWGRAFYDDDPENPRLADEYGVVIGTSHHEPLMRAHDEWRRYGKGGAWNYAKNAGALREFWRKGIERMGSYESVVTLAMRGDGDEAMSAEADVALLERIVKDQRSIIADVTGRDVTATPQVWALYKEVQEYYDKGMRVPDDVTVLLCDDNWGNIRKLPPLNEPKRAGGYGIYYHYDFVGGPRNYKWLNTNQIERVWQQMNMAYEYGAREIWVVNVGDIKPMEFPISFFLEYAWNPERWPVDRLPEYSRRWAEQQFGSADAEEIGDILDRYTKFSSRRKPEMLAPTTYSLVNFREAERVIRDYGHLVTRAEKLYAKMPAEAKDAFYQLVLHQPLASANLNELYVMTGYNRLFAEQGRSATNLLARRVAELYAKDDSITRYYNQQLSGGKWNHMMDQTHIGYTYWQQPDANAMPEVEEVDVPEEASMGVAIEGSRWWWPEEDNAGVLPEIDAFYRQERMIEVFNRGEAGFTYSASSAEPWVLVEPASGKVEHKADIRVMVDWESIPTGVHRVPITIAGPEDERAVVEVMIRNPAIPRPGDVVGFAESNGYISMDADHYGELVSKDSVSWMRIANLGRTGSAMSPVPVTSERRMPGGDGPRLEYQVYLFNTGEVKVHALTSPLLNVTGRGARYAVSFDDGPPVVADMLATDTAPDWKYPQYWNTMVSENIRRFTTRHTIDKPGVHVLKFWMVDPGVVLQKIVIETTGVPESYLGPPETPFLTPTR